MEGTGGTGGTGGTEGTEGTGGIEGTGGLRSRLGIRYQTVTSEGACGRPPGPNSGPVLVGNPSPAG